MNLLSITSLTPPKLFDEHFNILTKVSGDASCIEIDGKSTTSGANVQEWTFNGGANQKFYI